MLLADFSSVTWHSYEPGNLAQDIFTIPIEGALSASITYGANNFGEPLWPFQTEKNNALRKPTRQPGRTLGIAAVSFAVPTFGLLALTNPDFPAWTHIRGIVHAHLLTEIATTFAKVTFRRHRPSYDTEKALTARPRNDDSYSFFSGHSSHAFCFATYTSRISFEYAPRPAAWIYSTGIYGLAGWVVAVRAIDDQHHWSDVITAAVVGSAIGTSLFSRVMTVRAKNNAGISWQIEPKFALSPQTGLSELRLDADVTF